MNDMTGNSSRQSRKNGKAKDVWGAGYCSIVEDLVKSVKRRFCGAFYRRVKTRV